MKKKLTIAGMTGAECERTIREALAGVQSVSHVEISPKDGYATVETDCGDQVLIEVLGEAGFDVIKVEPDCCGTL